MKYTITIASLIATAGLASAATLFTSGFENNTGANVEAGNVTNGTGNATLTITDWSTDASVTAISNLTAVLNNAGGFGQTQGGTGAFASDDVAFIAQNHNTGVDADSVKGYSFTFTVDASWSLDSLTVLSAHTNNVGGQNQSFTSDLVYSISGGTLGSPLTETSTEVYGVLPAYHTVAFTGLASNTIGAGTYTVQVTQENFSGGGAYASFDGVTLEATAVPEPSSAALLGLGGLALIMRRRK